MRMVRIRHVGMRVPARLVTMPMAVDAGRHGCVRMRVMTVVVAMRMLVLHRLMLVLVPV